MKKIALLVLLASTFCARSQVNLNNGLTACYALNGNANETVNNLNGLVSSVTPTVNRFNALSSAMAFSGSTLSYIELPDNPNVKPLHALSLSCWIKTPVMIDQYICMTKNNLVSNFEAFNLCIEPSMRFMTRKCGPTGTDMVISTTTLSLDTWFHLVTTIDSSFVKLYVNGVLEASTPATFIGFDYVNGKKVYLGSTQESTYDAPFTGTIDNARFYNRVLNATEVSALYSQDPSCVPENTTGIMANSIGQTDFSMFPNPSPGVTTLHFNTSLSGQFLVKDMVGKTVNSGSFDDVDKLELDLTPLTSGLYFVEVQSGSNKQIQKVIKQ
ncbi:MAG: T9SS type A sorting domain-containing protein [Bacteroidia bacterium]|nr:T9SS type A sorting domain-containing protein [Bacteroidia bacterium]